MKKNLLYTKATVFAVIADIIIVLTCIPFIIINPTQGSSQGVCPGLGMAGVPYADTVCNPNFATTFISYEINHGGIVSISWIMLVFSFILIYIIFYAELRLLFYVLKPHKGKARIIINKRRLALGGFIAIPIILIFIYNLILSYFGLSFTF